MRKRSAGIVAIVCALLVAAVVGRALEADTPAELRAKAQKEQYDGNYRDAFAVYEKLTLDKDADPALVGADLLMGVNCLRSLGQHAQTDGFRESVLKVHGKNWRLLRAVASTYYADNHYGCIVAGEFERGSHRGGCRYVNSVERDRVRAMQLMTRALKRLPQGEGDGVLSGLFGNRKGEVFAFYREFASMVVGYRGYSDSWRLQYLADLSELPDYDEGYYYYGSGGQGAPVDADGNPVFHKVPESFDTAVSDGERWRWLMKRAIDVDKGREREVLQDYGSFLYTQFSVQSMANHGSFFRPSQAAEDKAETGTWALHTLGEDETIARLATGVKRFKLPDDANFIKLYRKLEETTTLAQIFENRRQFDKAAALWKKGGYVARAQQILEPWGQFDSTATSPAGAKPPLNYLFRNGKKVHFKAQEIRVAKLLKDVRRYLRSNPKQLDWEKMNISQVGYRLVHKDGKRYLGKTVAEWDRKLKPRAMHFDKRITIKAPMSKAGAYLVTATMEGGNTSKVVVWVADTTIVRKNLDGQVFFFVADAVTGKPIPGADVDFFGYYQQYLNREVEPGRWYNVRTRGFKVKADTQGQVMLKPKRFRSDYSWLITASTPDGRLAHMGFSGIWYGNYYDYEYNQTKVLTITDRPVYRPKQSVKFKFWVRHARYDQDDTSSFAKQKFQVQLTNPKGERVLDKQIRADAFGGVDGEYLLPDDAPLGVYYINLYGYGGSSFRVEEYKKPEFEVKVEAPDKPVMLGEKIKAKVVAKYYFGAPVTEAKVKYKVLRTNHSANWYPAGLWDWFYGSGYWWFGYDYVWYPGWRDWGVWRPYWWWWGSRSTPPELVAEAEVEIGKDGTFEVEIDTGLAQEFHPDTDHRYELVAEVTDKSRRTIVGQGAVLVARKPFKVYGWVDRGHYRVGETVRADFLAQTLDSRPIKGEGQLVLLRIGYEDGKPIETPVQKWDLDTDDLGKATVQMKASTSGQYRLSYKVTDSENHTMEGGYLFVVRGEGFDGKDFRFNDIELTPDKREYEPGEKVKLMINTEQADSTVLLFVRPANGVYKPPELISIDGKSAVREILVTKKDMPNFFVEAVTISNGKVFSEVREIIVPPEKRVLNLEVLPDTKEYKPGQKAKVKVKLTDFFGKPFVGSLVMSVYDRSVEYIAGGGNVPEIKAFFWKWRRSHYPSTESTLTRQGYPQIPPGQIGMNFLGAFGHLIADEAPAMETTPSMDAMDDGGAMRGASSGMVKKSRKAESAPRAPGRTAPPTTTALAKPADSERSRNDRAQTGHGGAEGQGAVQPAVRSKFADTAYWNASVTTDQEGRAEVEFDMPENLTGWKIKTWAMGHGTKVGEGTVEVVTSKKLLLRLQAPRFFVQKDEVVLSANIHNYLATQKTVTAVLETDGGCLESMDDTTVEVEIDANGEARVDWRVKVVQEGEAVVRMKALTDEESDAMEMRFPVYVHGMLKTESYCGVMRPESDSAKVTLQVPAERRIDQSRLEIRYSPTLAGSMVDALPYLVEYPYGCTEQTLNRFLPTVITQKILLDMGLDLKAIRDKRTNLNAQEIGDDRERSNQWQRWDRNPVFSQKTVNRMVRKGVKRLVMMQLSDGGWGWFSGWGEYSYPHTTAYVVHGFQVAQDNGVKLPYGVLDRGVQWLVNHQASQVRMIKNAPKRIHPWKSSADNLDAFVYMVLADAGKQDKEMLDFLYRDRNNLSVYAKAMFGMALHTQKHQEKLDMILRNIEQFLVMDDENHTAYLDLQNNGYWWYWYGSEYEAQAYYLKLLARTAPKSKKASGLVKYLLNNRKHATYWNSTRDTALCIEAMADYMRASGEDKPDMTLEVYYDGMKHKEVKIDPTNLFSFDNKFLLEGQAIESGEHVVELRRKGTGPVYFNAYLTNFTLEDYITKAGLEIKVNREYYNLNKVDKSIKVSGSHGQVVDQKVEKYERSKLADLATLKSGDLVEIELTIESKNDYEYIIFEDMKAAGFEPVEVRSGYTGNSLGAYMELRDERVAFFVRALARGKHSIAYRMRAEIPGKFSALPTRAYAMYAPELRANSDEIKLKIVD